MKRTLILLLFVCAGIVFGSLLGNITAGVNGLSWLAYGMNFGLTSPFVLDLGVLTLTFGIAFRLNVAVIIVTLLALVLGIFVSKKV
ncbi:MAG: DUF4321 domain-containing protein [Ruminococcaceae bacterium]|nr:DUF4321 domain-containing protein [Oscillospiraceae bacterium]